MWEAAEVYSKWLGTRSKKDLGKWRQVAVGRVPYPYRPSKETLNMEMDTDMYRTWSATVRGRLEKE